MSINNPQGLATPDYRLERLTAIKKLYPDLFTDEGNINIEEIHALVHDKVASVTEKFEFKWPGKSYAKKSAFTPSKARLLPQLERSINFDATQNVIIEGENLEVLKLLSKAYYNKIKCIYIDPPYNTGHDFVYNDDFSEGRQAYWEQNGVFRDGMKMESNPESSGRYHSNWLNMMLPRLTLAQMMLKDDGVIFVSIDDNEVHNLRKLMDEVFGEENFSGMITWRRRHNQPNDPTKMIAKVAEYILVYAKNLEFLKDIGVGKVETTGTFTNLDNDPNGAWASKPWKVGSNQSGTQYKIVTPSGKILDEEWMGDEETYKKLLSQNRIFFSKNGDGLPRKKYYQVERESEGQSAINWWEHTRFGHNQGATKTLEELFGQKNLFDNPKPIELIRGLLQVANVKNDDLILDFFAGSGSTGHAVMELNKEDGGNRRFILTQLPEEILEGSEAFKAGYKKISDITIERVKRAGERIKKEKPEVDTGFQVFKLTTSLFPENTYQPDPEKSEDENVVALGEYLEGVRQHMLFEPKGFETDLMYEILVKKGFMVTMKKEKLEKFTENEVWKVTDGNREALVCLDGDLKDGTVDLLEGTKDIQFVGLHRAVDTTRKWKMTVIFGESLVLV